MFANRLQIVLRNIRGIKELTFEAPTKHGVYVLTGVNGSGKSTLLTALSRISNTNAFVNGFIDSSFDQYAKAEIEYNITKLDGSILKVKFHRPKKNWTNIPKVSLAKSSPFSKVIFITASNHRFYASQNIGNIGNIEKSKPRAASPFIKDGLNEILEKKKFEHLRYTTIKNKGAGARNPRRSNKVYFIQDNGEIFSEINFSLGEKVLLNTLEDLQKVSDNSLLLIDEIELALHPRAQIRFYEFLRRIAEEKKLMVIISTHSPTLIRVVNNRFYIDGAGRAHTVITKCEPAYILKDVTVEQEINPDFLLFVEDVQAKRLLSCIVRKIIQNENCGTKETYRIVPVGPWEETIKLMVEFQYIAPFTTKKVQAFPDKDAEESINTIRQKDDGERTDTDRRRIALWDNQLNNITPLHVTPELGIWNWMNTEGAEEEIQSAITLRYGEQAFKLKDLLDALNRKPTTGKNDREKAKYRLMDIIGEIKLRVGEDRENVIYDLLFETYVDSNYELIKSYYKHHLCRIRNRR